MTQLSFPPPGGKSHNATHAPIPLIEFWRQIVIVPNRDTTTAYRSIMEWIKRPPSKMADTKIYSATMASHSACGALRHNIGLLRRR